MAMALEACEMRSGLKKRFLFVWRTATWRRETERTLVRRSAPRRSSLAVLGAGAAAISSLQSAA
eukprot:scaffold4501_cov108-Isochrysis_galbana.AAC.6